ncbi:MAG: DUF4838 domain-containing protein [Clostridiales bacterium]|jgi:hypothetical protein|nr:DUF4838 domain-containing protein [Clostridiales bacterium]
MFNATTGKRTRALARVIAVWLVLFTTLGFFTACAGKKKSDEGGGDPASLTNPVYPGDDSASTGGIHSVSSVKTDAFITDGNMSEYKIIMPSKAETDADPRHTHYKMASDELKALISDACGAGLQIVADDGLTYSDSAKYLSVGINDYAESAGITFDKSVLGDNGCRIVTKGGSVFMGGANVYGTLNSVYEFLKHAAGLAMYDEHEAVFWDDAAARISFYNMDITEVPDFQWRIKHSGMLTSERNVRRFRANMINDSLMNVGAVTGQTPEPFHNEFEFIPPSTWRSSHPMWFADNTQYHLCFLAHGDAAEKEAFDNEFFRVLKETVIANPNLDYISITQEDERSWCRCPACTAEFEKYGTDAAVMIKFCNSMMRRLKAWIASDDNTYFSKDRVINIIFFAYQNTVNAPVKKADDGTWVPIDNDVICDDNVYPYYAPIETYYTKPFDAETNQNNLDNLTKWRVLADKMWLWPYQTNYSYYLYPYNSFGVMQHNYKLFKTLGRTDYIFDLQQHNQFAATGFHEFKSWLSYQLLWNTDLSVAALTDEFFNGYFKTAAAPMRKFYEEMRAYMTYLENHQRVNGGLYFVIDRPEYWPKPILDRWMGYVDEAFAAIEPLKSAADYNRFYLRIVQESIFPRYALISLYPGKYSDRALLDMKTSWKRDVLSVGMNRVSEHVFIDTVFTEWGV